MSRYIKPRLHASYSVGSQPVQIAQQNFPNRVRLVIANWGNQTVYLDKDGSLGALGMPLVAGARLVDDESHDAWFATCPTGTATVSVVETIAA